LVHEHGKPVMAIQVCMSMAHQATLKRECEPLIATAKYFGTKDNLIVTLDEEQRIARDGITIHALPAWKWCLE
jgi:predicted AAA+ superfamily ATPase